MSMTGEGRAPRWLDVVLYALGVSGLTASLTVVFLGMRAVLDVGGFCAEGGPYVISQPCPEGVPLLMVAGIFGLFLFGGLMAVKGGVIGGPYGALVALAWPALFLSLGWNFLEYSLWPPEPTDRIAWGWLIPGVIFVIMGGGPLFALWPSRSSGASATNASRALLLHRLAQLRAQREASADDVVTGLERLAALRRSGSLTELEFERAKQLLLEGRHGG